jgi:iron-sulfur cluster assembly accessory protein
MTDQSQIIVTNDLVKRIEDLRSNPENEVFNETTYLRVAVIGGGCSGFKYMIEPDRTVDVDDIIFENAVIVDEMSLIYLQGAEVDFEQSMLGASFVINNPNAQSSCGCQTSFSVDPSKLS